MIYTIARESTKAIHPKNKYFFENEVLRNYDELIIFILLHCFWRLEELTYFNKKVN